MKLKIEKFERISFPVSVVMVTEANMAQAAKWCGGTIRHMTKTVRGENGESERVKVRYIKVDVHNPLNDRQTKAFADDRILESEAGFKVYTERAFEKAFRPIATHMAEAKTPPRYRDSRNGEYVTEAFAHANPDITVREQDYKVVEQPA